eukprot:m.90565 g.90565  ORF g.90565 m.90565 type:complete len:153 (+) comp9867_c0_seq1:50-508(+)
MLGMIARGPVRRAVYSLHYSRSLSAPLPFTAVRRMASARPKAASPKIHVLLVNLKFTSAKHKLMFRDTWADLAKIVYDKEPDCLSYEFCDSTEDETKAIIYERYTTKAALDGIHQETLKEFDLMGRLPQGFSEHVDIVLTNFTETNLGHMDR